MLVGVDFDNTLVDYTKAIKIGSKSVFGITSGENETKLSIKAKIRSEFGENAWTQFQGDLYTKYIYDAQIDQNAMLLIKDLLIDPNNSVEIVSHKTKYPIIGPKIDMRVIAKDFLRKTSLALLGQDLDIPITFSDTLEDKIAYINERPFDVFVDDLQEVIEKLSTPNKILFVPSSSDHNNFAFATNSWSEISLFIRSLIEC